jgi:transposase InsO family protein
VEFLQDIIFRFGIPNSIITDLGSNFTSSEFFDFCEQKICISGTPKSQRAGRKSQQNDIGSTQKESL